MLIRLQFPLIDLRPLCDDDSNGRLRRPHWPHPEPLVEFVRNFGSVQRRRRSERSSVAFPDELYYCAAANALRLNGLNSFRIPSQHGPLSIHCIARRLYCDGVVLARVEVAFEVRPAVPATFADLSTVVCSILGLRVACGSGPSTVVRQLQLQGPTLAALLQRATANGVDRSDRLVRQVRACEPCVLTSVSAQCRFDPPPDVAVIDEGMSNSTLAHTRVYQFNRCVSAWYAMSRSEARANPDADAVLRIHAEYQSLLAVLRALDEGLIAYDAGSDRSERLDRYLLNTARLFTDGTRVNSRFFSTASLVKRCLDAAEATHWQLAVERLRDARRQVQKNIKHIIPTRSTQPSVTLFHSNGSMHVGQVTGRGDLHVTSTQIDFGDGNVFKGDVVAAGTIEHSFNKASAVDDQEMRETLQALMSSVARLCESMNNAEQQSIARKARAFVDEASADEPDRSFLSVTADGLVKAASAVGQMAEPVIAAVKKVLALLGAS